MFYDTYFDIKDGFYECEVMTITSNEEKVTLYVLYKDETNNSLKTVSVYYNMKPNCKDMSFNEMLFLLKSCGFKLDDHKKIEAMYNSTEIIRQECLKWLIGRKFKLLVTTKRTGFKELRLSNI